MPCRLGKHGFPAQSGEDPPGVVDSNAIVLVQDSIAQATFAQTSCLAAASARYSRYIWLWHVQSRNLHSNQSHLS